MTRIRAAAKNNNRVRGIKFRGRMSQGMRNKESSGIELVYVCVSEGGEGRLGFGFILLYSIFYLSSILLVPSLCTIFYIFLLVFYLLWPKSYMLYSILYLVSTIFNIVYVHSIYLLCLRFLILHSIYATYFDFYTPSSESLYYVLYLTSCILSSMA